MKLTGGAKYKMSITVSITCSPIGKTDQKKLIEKESSSYSEGKN